MEHGQIYHMLKEHGIRPSRQRVMIFQELLARSDHPTAEMVYESLKPEIRSLSKTTVYNTMKLFGEKDLVHVIQLDGQESRFDYCGDGHVNFYCKKCGRIFDQYLSTMPKIDEEATNFSVEDSVVLLRGICSDCQGKNS